MKIALIQMDIKWEDKEANLERAAGFIGRAAGEGADVAVLPEMFSTGFSMAVSRLGEPCDGGSAGRIAELSKTHGINIIAGLQISSTGKGRNSALVYDRQGGCVANYTKLHPFSPAGEERYFQAGEGPVVFDLDGRPSSVFICYDLRFPEVFRAVAPRVALIFVIANWPSSREDHWVSLLKARAIENQCLVIGVNRAGRDGNGLLYTGRSCVFGPEGTLLCSCGSNEELLLCEADPEEAIRTRLAYPFLRDMAPGPDAD